MTGRLKQDDQRSATDTEKYTFVLDRGAKYTIASIESKIMIINNERKVL